MDPARLSFQASSGHYRETLTGTCPDVVGVISEKRNVFVGLSLFLQDACKLLFKDIKPLLDIREGPAARENDLS